MNDTVLLTRQELESSFPKAGLFRDGVPWLLSPRPFELTRKQVKSLQSLGHVLARFYDACAHIYHASANGREHEWVARLLDTGKPGWLVEAQRSKAMRTAVPLVMRPDLILTGEGWVATELDSVPGGQGVTAFLAGLYARAGWPVLGGADGMAEGFKAAHPQGAHILVSDESADYRAEMEDFAARLGDNYTCGRAEDADPGSLPESVYRFFEWFDSANIPAAKALAKRAADGGLPLSPPPVPHLEEKLWLALFHTPGLQATWEKHLRGAHLEQLRRVIPRAWVADPAPMPPQAALPWLNVHSWDDVARFSQKERRLVLKISGFHELAWGSRGVFIGHDMPSEEWEAAVNRALLQYDLSPWMMQEFHTGSLVEHPYYDPLSGTLRQLEGRVRLCPYYYRLPDGTVQLGGCLATIVPKEKKKIHGMQDGILVPCSLPTSR